MLSDSDCAAFVASAEMLVKNLSAQLESLKKAANASFSQTSDSKDVYDLESEITRWEGEGGATADGPQFR